MLQWRQDVQDAILLMPALQRILQLLLAALQSDESGTPTPASASLLLTSGNYSVQLVLSALNVVTAATSNLAQQHLQHQQLHQANLELAVCCAQSIPSTAVHSAALEFVNTLASRLPLVVLSKALDIVAIAGQAAAGDNHAAVVASQVLHAVAATWLQSGAALEDLASAVLYAAADLPHHRQLEFVRALTSALPQVSIDRAWAQQLLFCCYHVPWIYAACFP